MSDITKAVVFSQALIDLIKRKRGEQDFSYHNWNDDDLLPLRKFIRGFYRKEQKGICAYCRNDVSLQSAANSHVEHIAPKSKYFTFIFEPKNLCVVCADCNEIKKELEVNNEEEDTVKNGQKRKMYPKSSNAFKIVHPHFDCFDDHIQKFGDFYVDKTTKGHFTIGACRLNRKLQEFGWDLKLYSDKQFEDVMHEFLSCSESLSRVNTLKKLKKMLNNSKGL